MPLTPIEIKDKLTKALDDDKNVIDEEAVEEVITLLEASTLTKEILEQTRLGRDINLLRKTSKNQDIAKRARNLIKAWNKLIQNPGSPQVVNGQLRVSPGLSPALSKSQTPNKFLQSPALAQARQQSVKATSAGSPVANNALRSNQHPRLAKRTIQERKSKPGVAAKLPIAGTNQSSAAPISINSNDDSNLSWPGTPPCAPNENSHDRLGEDDSQSQSSTGNKNGHLGSVKSNFNFEYKSVNHSTSQSSKSRNRASDQKDVSKTNVANRKRTRQSASNDDFQSYSELPESKHPCLMTNPRLSSQSDSKNDVINGTYVRKNSVKPSPLTSDNPIPDKKSSFYKGFRDRDSSSLSLSQLNHLTPSSDPRALPPPLESRKVGRVKTTEQLIEDVQRKSATPVGTSVIAQIRTNQIKKETDTQKSALPVGVKKRGRKKKNQNLSDAEPVSEVQRLAQTKSEYIERFLETSVAPTPGEDVYEPPIPNLRQESLEENPIALGACSSSFSQPAYDGGFSSYSSRQDKPDSGPSASPPEAREIVVENGGHLPPLNLGPPDINAPPSERLSEAQILAHLPPIDFQSIDWTSSSYAAPQPIHVTSETVERLHHENLDGVNGTYDRDGQFQSWADMLTCDSIYDEPLFILPYVMPND